MPWRRAVVMSQAPGFSGTPSRGQCSSAATSASCTHSSARSKSPRLRTSAAVNRPASSRKTAATASLVTLRALVLDGGSNFHVAHRPGLRELDGGLHVGRLDDAQAADRLLRLDEWAVDDADLAAGLPDRRRRARRLQLGAPVGDLAAVGLEPLEDVRVDLLLLGRGIRLVLHAVVDEEECVLRHIRPPKRTIYANDARARPFSTG